MNSSANREQEEFRRRVCGFFQEELASLAEQIERDEKPPADSCEQLGTNDLLAINSPGEHGGQREQYDMHHGNPEDD